MNPDASSSLTPSTAAGLAQAERQRVDRQEVPMRQGDSSAFDTRPSLTDHSSGSEPHLPAASMQTHSGVNPSGLELHQSQARASVGAASLQREGIRETDSSLAAGSVADNVPMQLSLSTPAGGAPPAAVMGDPSAEGDNSTLNPGMRMGLARGSATDREAAILSQFPAPSHGNDAKLRSNFEALASGLRETAGIMGAELAAAFRTAPAQFSDAWQKLSAKTSEMKQQHAGGRGRDRDSVEMKQTEGGQIDRAIP